MKENNKDKLKIVFFGLGSIGKKHATIIKKNYDFDIFAYRTRKGQEKSDLKIKEYDKIKDVFSIKPHIAFITNPTFLHVDTALKCAKNNVDLFIEKPISHSLIKTDELEKEIKKRELFTYIAYNLRFHPVIKNLKKILDKEIEIPISFNVTCRSYLPHWRPFQDYSKSYSAKKETGGGVILDLSHEFDYISWLFGEIKNIQGYYDKISDLKIYSEDNFDGKITTIKKIKGKIHLDLYSLDNERKIQIFFKNMDIEGDLINNIIKIKYDNKKERIKKFKTNINITYKKQIEYFFNEYYKRNYNIMNNYSEALKTFQKIIKFKEEKVKK